MKEAAAKAIETLEQSRRSGEAVAVSTGSTGVLTTTSKIWHHHRRQDDNNDNDQHDFNKGKSFILCDLDR